MENKIKLGTSGNPPNFFKSKFGKDRINAVDWISSIGLNAYELLMTYGARTKPEVAKIIGEKAKKLNVALSVHAPYYVVLSSPKQEVFLENIRGQIYRKRSLTKKFHFKMDLVIVVYYVNILWDIVKNWWWICFPFVLWRPFLFLLLLLILVVIRSCLCHILFFWSFLLLMMFRCSRVA